MTDENNVLEQPEEQPEPQQAQPEPQQQTQEANPYQSIIDGQNEQIAALIAANKALTEQVTSFIQNGAQLGAVQQAQPEPKPTQTFNAPSLATDESWSLEDLAKEIGRK